MTRCAIFDFDGDEGWVTVSSSGCGVKSQKIKPATMSNSNVPTSTACCDSGEGAFSLPHDDVVVIAVFSLVVFALCLMVFVFVKLREKMALQAQLEEAMALHDRKEERRSYSTRKRKKSISDGLIIKEWVPPEDAPVVESTGKDRVTSPSGEGAFEASHSPAPPINTSSPVSCAMGSDDCDSLVGEEEMTGCAICLSHFRPQQLVCESSNSLCQHIFHKECMIDWLMKDHDDCPMCREVYLIKTI
jgi:hypothetical protein